jgi:hypothetical protein
MAALSIDAYTWILQKLQSVWWRDFICKAMSLVCVEVVLKDFITDEVIIISASWMKGADQLFVCVSGSIIFVLF